MQMMYRLPSFVARVHHDAKAVAQALGPSQICSGRHQMTEQMLVLILCLRHRSDMFLGNDQQVRGRLGVNVRKPDAELVLIHPVRRNRSIAYFAKQTIGRRLKRRRTSSCFHETFTC